MFFFAVGMSFGPVWEGIRHSCPPWVSQIWVKQLVKTRYHWVNIFIVRRKGPDGQNGSMMNTKVTCSTWKGMGSVRLYFSRDSPCDENKQSYNTRLVAAQVNKDHTFQHTPGQRCQVCCWCIIKDSWKRHHHYRHMKHKDTKSCRETPGTSTQNGQIQMVHPWTL